jgi:hypothetical protein
MLLAKLRGWVHLLLAVALVTGVVTQGVHAADMSAKMAVANSGMPMPDSCGGCCGDDSSCASSGVCSVACGHIPALPVAGVRLHPVPLHSGEPGAVLTRVGWSAPPDPYPPRPTIMS